jgi:outer membrane protein TolC
MRALAHARALYQGGITDFRAVLDQQQRVLQSESAMEQSLTKQRTDLIALYKALGGGWNGESR